LKLVDQLHDIIMGHEMADTPEPVLAPNQIPPVESIPETPPIEIVGMLEYLDARGGKEDLFRISSETEKDFGSVITVAKAAELLDFVDTPSETSFSPPRARGSSRRRPRNGRISGRNRS